MNKQVEKLILNQRKVINDLRTDRENCKTSLGWEAVNKIIMQKLEFISELKECL